MKIGYSAWGFVGDGVLDSPDGGRLTRALMLEHLIKKGHEIIWLQENRDVDVNGKLLFHSDNHYDDEQKQTLCKLKYDDDFPEIDVLFVEWRWRLPGRNCDVDKNSDKYTPDFDRQTDLITYYRSKDTKICVWDKDETMTEMDEYFVSRKCRRDITIFSPALFPIKNLFARITLHFPCDLEKIKGTKINASYENDIGYVGSQYERDYQVYKYVNPIAKYYSVVFVGNWTKYPEKAKRNKVNFPDIKFGDRILPKNMGDIYNKSLSTVLLCKQNYAEHGHITQRLHECLSFGTLAIGLREQRGIEQFIPEELIIDDAFDLNNLLWDLTNSTNEDKQKLLDDEIARLKPFDIHNVIKVIESVIK